MSAPGLQTHFGDPIGADVARQVKEQGFTIGRIGTDIQGTNTQVGDISIAALQQELLNVGVQPLTNIRLPESVRVIAGTGALAEFGNEFDLEDHFGWPTVESYWHPCRDTFIPLCLELGVRGYIGVISNLNKRGFDFLKKIPWSTIDPRICASFHRYPERGKPPTTPHAGFKSREAEVAEFRKIVGNRPIACTETGFHRNMRDGGYTEAEREEHYAWEADFGKKMGYDFCIAFQINDGPEGDTSKEGTFGMRDHRGVWKPAAKRFTGVDAPTEVP